MKIESIIRRQAGTRVQLDDVEYHFRPTEADERHCAEVTVAAHIQRFLSITEGYRLTDEAVLAGVQEADGSVRPLDQMSAEELAPLAEALQAEKEPVELADEPDLGNRDALVEQYKARFGKPPHHKLSAERIAQILDEEA